MWRKILRGICFVILVVSLGIVAKEQYGFYKEREAKEKLEELAGIPKEEEKEAEFSPDWNALKQQNESVNGYLYFPECEISFPVVQASDNDYYLYRDIYQNPSEFGAVFMDWENNPAYTDTNTTIYGHAVTGGTGMFTELKRLQDEKFFRENKEFTLYTPDMTYKCEIFAFEYINPYDIKFTTNFENEEQYNEWIEALKSQSMYWRDLEVPNSKQRSITLSTCADGGANRFQVHARLVPVTDDSKAA